MKRYLAIVILVVCFMLTGCSNPVENGLKLLEEQKYEEAIGVFEQAVDRKKNLGEAYRGLGIAYWEQEDYEAAREMFLNALNQDAIKTGTLYNFLGICEMKLENPESALSYFRLGLECEDSSEELLREMKFNEVVAYEQKGDWKSAKVKLEAYLEQYPEDADAKKELEFLKTR